MNLFLFFQKEDLFELGRSSSNETYTDIGVGADVVCVYLYILLTNSLTFKVILKVSL